MSQEVEPWRRLLVKTQAPMRRLLPLALLCASCALLPAPIPMTAEHYRMPDRDKARCLMILLPGAGSGM